MASYTKYLGKINMGNTHITGDIQHINKPADIVFVLFSDFSRFQDKIPEDKKGQVTLTKDTIIAQAQGMQMGVQVTERQAPSLIVMQQYGTTPFAFTLNLHLTPAGEGCDLQLELDAELNMMIKMMLGGKLKDFVNQFSEQLAKGLNQ